MTIPDTPQQPGSTSPLLLRFPPVLREGDRVAVIAPSSPFDPGEFEAGLSVLRRIGLVPVVNEEVYRKQGYLAGSDRERARSLEQAFADPDVKGVFCARGGYGAMRALPYINEAAVTAVPKVFMGFSDITALHCFLYSRCRMAVFHGPVAASLAGADARTLDSLKTLFSEESLSHAIPEIGRVRAGTAAGRLFGGNLATLCALTGTPWQPDLAGHILFLEERGEALYRIDRMLCQMKLAGMFENVRGVVLGSFTDCGEQAPIERLLAQVFSDPPVPVASGLEAGHGPVNRVLPMGREALLDVDAGMLTIHPPGVAT